MLFRSPFRVKASFIPQLFTKNFEVRSGATVTLNAGTYEVWGSWVLRDSRIIINGDVKIQVNPNLALTGLTRLSSGYWHVRDTQCGYTAIGRRALERLPLGDLYRRYGFPNDLLAKLSEQGATVVDCPVTPIYGDEQSGIRIPHVVGPIFLLLVRSGLRRVWRQRLRRGAFEALADEAG